METTKKNDYEAPRLTVVTFKVERGFADSGGPMRGFLSLGNSWNNDGGDAWDGSFAGGDGGYFGGGWTDNGGSAWD